MTGRNRDDFTQRTKELIAARAGYNCSIPTCLAPTSGPTSGCEGSVNVGVAAHISGAAEGGPRFNPNLTREQRQSAENGIWLCSTHGALVDRDLIFYKTELLIKYKYEAEERALSQVGQPRGFSQGNLIAVNGSWRYGNDERVLVDNQLTPRSIIFDEEIDDRISWFVSAFAIQFSIRNKNYLKCATVERLIISVHETRPVPEYRKYGGICAFPVEADLFYVEVEKNVGLLPREFSPIWFCYQRRDDTPERKDFPVQLVIDDELPAQIALRISTRSAGLYLLSVDVVVSSGDLQERVVVMSPQWVIFEEAKALP